MTPTSREILNYSPPSSLMRARRQSTLLRIHLRSATGSAATLGGPAGATRRSLPPSALGAKFQRLVTSRCQELLLRRQRRELHCHHPQG
jgi:hypothetical protein